MVQVTEARVVLPFTAEEFKRGQQYSIWKTKQKFARPGEKCDLLSSVPFQHEVYGKGTFTHSAYRLGNRLPEWVGNFVPADALVVHEKSWVTYPYIRTEVAIPYFTGLKVEVRSIHLDDNGSTENALGLSDEDLAIRKVDIIDIGVEEVALKDYREELDPLKVHSRITGRGPLAPGWQQQMKPLMCAYKVVKAEINYWGVASTGEALIISTLRQAFLLSHRNCFGMIDEWYNMTFSEVMALQGPMKGERALVPEELSSSSDADETTCGDNGPLQNFLGNTDPLVLVPSGERMEACAVASQ